ncbi:MAG TPA: MBL fold metallo-hydrolase [Caldimonas sp.]|nr:MBL fold metallo-hydrolase [Caldimonas sp.]
MAVVLPPRADRVIDSSACARALPDFVAPIGHGIQAIDTGFHRPLFDAAYLIVERGRAAFVDAGTNHSVPRLLAALAANGLAAEAVDFVIPTHVHLDHAGGAGLLMQQLPKARLVVHPRGARHLVDPVHLVKGATAVYGAAEIERSYGTLVPVAAERIVKTSDGMTIDLAGRPLVFLDTPGHAMHHHCVWDAASRGFFTGDTFGLSYRDFDTAAGPWIMPTTTPVQFQPEALRRSIERMLAFAPECIYATHYGRIGEVPRLAALLLAQLDAMVAFARATPPGPDRHGALMRGLEAIHLKSLRAHGVTISDERIRALLGLDLELNAQGIAIWLDRTRA